MKKIISIVIVVLICVMFLVTLLPMTTGEVITDLTGDVIHRNWDDGELILEIDNRPNVDIIETIYNVENNTMTLQMTVVGSIVLGENFSYVLWCGMHSFGFYYGDIYNSSSLIDFEITDNAIICTFELSNNESISEYELNGVALEAQEQDEWFDQIPDLYPPYVLFGVGAGRHYTSFGRGIRLKVNNIHDYESVTCSLEINFEGFLGLWKTHVEPIIFTVGPNEEIEKKVGSWVLKPIVCNVKVCFKISDLTISLTGLSIGQWFYFTEIIWNPALEPYDIPMPEVS